MLKNKAKIMGRECLRNRSRLRNSIRRVTTCTIRRTAWDAWVFMRRHSVLTSWHTSSLTAIQKLASTVTNKSHATPILNPSNTGITIRAIIHLSAVLTWMLTISTIVLLAWSTMLHLTIFLVVLDVSHLLTIAAIAVASAHDVI